MVYKGYGANAQWTIERICGGEGSLYYDVNELCKSYVHIWGWGGQRQLSAAICFFHSYTKEIANLSEYVQYSTAAERTIQTLCYTCYLAPAKHFAAEGVKPGLSPICLQAKNSI